MNDMMKSLIEEKEESKTRPVTITLSKRTLRDIEKEQKRVGVRTRSKMIELIISTYSSLPLEGSN